MKCSEIKVIKKDGTKEEFNVQKVLAAVNKSANRAMIIFSKAESKFICEFVEEKAEELDQSEVPIAQMHNIVEGALERVNPVVAKSYRDYRNYKQDFVQMLDEVYKKSQSIMYIGDKENSNTDSALVSTKRSLIFNELNKSLYQKFFMTVEELQACRDGYIYIHDMSARRDTMNCCLFDVNEVLSGGFEMGNIWYNEPKTLDVAFDVIGDIVLSAASQQYGGFTVPNVENILAPYADMPASPPGYPEPSVPRPPASPPASRRAEKIPFRPLLRADRPFPHRRSPSSPLPTSPGRPAAPSARPPHNQPLSPFLRLPDHSHPPVFPRTQSHWM